MYDDTFIAPLPRSQLLSEIEMVADFITTKVVAAKKAYITSTNSSEKMDILLCLVSYQSILTLLNSAYYNEDRKALDRAKEIYRTFPDITTDSTDFSE